MHQRHIWGESLDWVLYRAVCVRQDRSVRGGCFFLFPLSFSRRWVVSTNFGNRALYRQQVEMVSLYGNAGIRKRNKRGKKKLSIFFFFSVSLSLFVRDLFYRLLSLSHTARHAVRVYIYSSQQRLYSLYPSIWLVKKNRERKKRERER